MRISMTICWLKLLPFVVWYYDASDFVAVHILFLKSSCSAPLYYKTYVCRSTNANSPVGQRTHPKTSKCVFSTLWLLFFFSFVCCPSLCGCFYCHSLQFYYNIAVVVIFVTFIVAVVWLKDFIHSI